MGPEATFSPGPGQHDRFSSTQNPGVTSPSFPPLGTPSTFPGGAQPCPSRKLSSHSCLLGPPNHPAAPSTHPRVCTWGQSGVHRLRPRGAGRGQWGEPVQIPTQPNSRQRSSKSLFYAWSLYSCCWKRLSFTTECGSRSLHQGRAWRSPRMAACDCSGSWSALYFPDHGGLG